MESINNTNNFINNKAKFYGKNYGSYLVHHVFQSFEKINDAKILMNNLGIF